VAFEIHRPDLVGACGHGQSRMRHAGTAPRAPHPRTHQTQPTQPPLNGAHARHCGPRMFAAELAMDFLGTPIWATPTPARDGLEPTPRQPAGRTRRAPRTIPQRRRAATTKPSHPLVSGGATDTPSAGQLLEGLTTSQRGLDQALADLDKRVRFPRHGRGTRTPYTKTVRDVLSPLCPPCLVPVPPRVCQPAPSPVGGEAWPLTER
jgi:hypothetical protein